MPARQTWPLSQDANKRSGVCSACLAKRQLHDGDGRVHRHGPRDNPCPGSGQPPLQNSAQTAASQSAPAGTATRSRNTTPVSGPSSAVQGSASQAASQSVSTTASPSSVLTQSPSFQHPCLQRPTIKHIPKSARPTCASALEAAFRRIEHDPGAVSAWFDLLNFGNLVLQAPARTGRSHNLCSLIKKRIASIGTGASAVQDERSVLKKSSGKSNSRENAVRAKLEEGNVSAAVRILCSEESLAENNLDTLNKLKDKHPSASSSASPVPLPDSVFTPALQVTEHEVLKAIRSFPAGSAGGPDGLRPQHLLEIVTCKESAPNFLPALTSFVNLLLRGV